MGRTQKLEAIIKQGVRNPQKKKKGLKKNLCMVAYALVLAISYLPGMAVITLNVVCDAATTVIVSYKENELDKDVYNS